MKRRRRLRLTLEIENMLAVHAIRALHTAVAGLDGIRIDQVSLGRAELRYEGYADDSALDSALRSTLDVIGLRLIALHIEPDRQLPLAQNAR